MTEAYYIVWREIRKPRTITHLWRSTSETREGTEKLLNDALVKLAERSPRRFFSSIPSVERLPVDEFDGGAFHCKRSDGVTDRAWFRSREEAEAFRDDPENRRMYAQDEIAHLCDQCGFFHLSNPEWLATK
jgi:hypothetical protein